MSLGLIIVSCLFRVNTSSCVIFVLYACVHLLRFMLLFSIFMFFFVCFCLHLYFYFYFCLLLVILSLDLTKFGPNLLLHHPIQPITLKPNNLIPLSPNPTLPYKPVPSPISPPKSPSTLTLTQTSPNGSLLS